MNFLKRTRLSGLTILCGSFISGCGAVQPKPLTPKPPVTFTPIALPATPEPALVGWKQKATEEKLKRAIKATSELIGSELFQSKLAALNDLHDGSNLSPVPSHELLSLYVEKRLPAHYVQDGEGYQAQTGTTPTCATINLGSKHVERWADGNSRAELLRSACVVNTIAHEWTHTIPGHYDGFRFVDGHHKRSANPLVSYTVGSVAHCAFLEKAKLLRDDKFWECVEAVGTNVFNGGSVCDQEGGLQGILEDKP